MRIAITTAVVSENGRDVYQDIVNYMATKLDRKCELPADFSYQTVSALIGAEQVDTAFVCGLPHVDFHDQGVPVMQVQGYGARPRCFAYVIVQKDAPYTCMGELRGMRLAYYGEPSNSGYSMPRAQWIERDPAERYVGVVQRSGYQTIQ